MATTETNTELGKQIVEDAKRYVLYSWSVQDAINPIAVERAEGRYFFDYDGNRYLDFASQLVNVSIGHSHPKVVQAIKDQAENKSMINTPPTFGIYVLLEIFRWLDAQGGLAGMERGTDTLGRFCGNGCPPFCPAHNDCVCRGSPAESFEIPFLVTQCRGLR